MASNNKMYVLIKYLPPNQFFDINWWNLQYISVERRSKMSAWIKFFLPTIFLTSIDVCSTYLIQRGRGKDGSLW